jgi:hypothetical protein
MQSSFLIACDEPFIGDGCAAGEGCSFEQVVDAFAHADDGAGGVKVVGGVVFVEVLVAEVGGEVPGDGLLFVEGVDGLPFDSHGQELGGEGEILPPAVVEEFQLEGFEHG